LKLDDGIKVTAATPIQAKSNNGEALCTIGSKYMSKRSNYSKAMAWYQLAANINHPFAYFNIGLLYKDGEGVVQDYDAAMDYFLKAAAGNDSSSMIYIGALFIEGKGVPWIVIKLWNGVIKVICHQAH
jgi:TPR repeat protein